LLSAAPLIPKVVFETSGGRTPLPRERGVVEGLASPGSLEK